MNIKQFFNSRVYFLLIATFSLSTFLSTVSYGQGDEPTVEQEESGETTNQDDSGIPSDEASIAAGEKLFKGNCKSCHKLDEVAVGPALGKVGDRHDVDWLVKWISNSAGLIASGDEEAIAIYEEFNKAAMPAFPFEREQIINILAYLQNPPAPPAQDVAVGEGVGVGATSAASGDNTTLIFILSIVLVILVLIIFVLILMSALLMKHLKSNPDNLDEEDSELLNQRHSVFKVILHPAFIGGVVTIALLVGLWLFVVDGLYWVGTQGGYQPTQPIAFSHKLHAGEHEIDCNYCHTGVRKAKSANIPSPNICMNCHSAIKTESPQIAKIYEAIDYDPETQTYGDNVKPIEWVRIHNLPDLAYFNHSQHVKVGGIECQTCHGPIEEMEVVYQYSELTMGWCINCHRETAVNAKGNDYYDKLLQLHEEKGSNDPMTVEDIGGLECSKCHY